MKKFFNAISKSFKSDPNKLGSDGLNRLQRAILENNYDQAKKLIEEGVDYNDRGLLNWPPLHLALMRDRHLIASLLISSGADVTQRDLMQRTPLHIAAEQGQDYLALQIMKKKPDMNAKDEDGCTPLHLLSSAKPDLIPHMLEHGADINAKDKSGNTPLHDMLEHPAMAAALLAYGPDVNLKNDYRNSAYKLFLNSDTLVRDRYLMLLMLENHADTQTRNRDGENIAMIALRQGLNQDLELLIRKVNLEDQDHAGLNLLHKAARANNYNGLALALSHAPELIDQKNNQGLTVLGDYLNRSFEWRYMSSYELFAKSVQLLIEHGADVNTRDSQGRTLLHFAAKTGEAKFMQYLIDQKAALDVRDRDGKAPIHMILARKDIDMLDALLDAGADPDQKDDRGWTILDHFAKAGDRNSPMVQRLIVAGGQYNKQLPLNPDEIRRRDFFDKGPRFGGPGFNG